MRESVRQLVERPDFKLSDDRPMEDVNWVVGLTDSFASKATDEEATALVELLSRSDDLFYEVTWAILHFIETAPGWPIWSVLSETKGEWAELLELRSRNAGLTPPPGITAADV